MTHADALLLFNGLNDSDEINDFYENELFEYKKFFLSKAPIAKLFEGRLTKLAKLEEAYQLLSSQAIDTTINSQNNYKIETSDKSILDTYLAFQKHKNQLKIILSNASNTTKLIQIVRNLVELEKSNAGTWKSEIYNEENIIVSKEPDPMYLLEAIKVYRFQKGETFSQLKNHENNPPEILIQEMKRLSLLYKKF